MFPPVGMGDTLISGTGKGKADTGDLLLGGEVGADEFDFSMSPVLNPNPGYFGGDFPYSTTYNYKVGVTSNLQSPNDFQSTVTE